MHGQLIKSVNVRTHECMYVIIACATNRKYDIWIQWQYTYSRFYYVFNTLLINIYINGEHPFPQLTIPTSDNRQPKAQMA